MKKWKGEGEGEPRSARESIGRRLGQALEAVIKEQDGAEVDVLDIHGNEFED